MQNKKKKICGHARYRKTLFNSFPFKPLMRGPWLNSLWFSLRDGHLVVGYSRLLATGELLEA